MKNHIAIIDTFLIKTAKKLKNMKNSDKREKYQNF